MKIFNLLRHYTPVGTFGILYYNNADFCKIIERAHKTYDTQHPCIDEGNYIFEPYLSPTKGHVFLAQNVPGRTFIEMHIANKPSELLGCLAPVNKFACLGGEWGGLESGVQPDGAFIRFQRLVGNDPSFQINITSFRG